MPVKVDPKKHDPQPKIDQVIDLKGTVLGYDDDHYTMPIHPALVYLKIHVRDEKDKEHVYDTLEKHDMRELQKNYPDIYNTIVEFAESFTPTPVGEATGHFELNKVPVGWWCYIVAAYVEKKSYDFTEKFGNNGFDENKELTSDMLHKSQTIEGIIVPVHDRWYKKLIAPPKKDDVPKTVFVPGIIKDDEY